MATYEQLAREEGDPVPVLGVRADDEALALALRDGRPPRPTQSGEGRDCVLAREDDYLPFAAALARWTGRELVISDHDFEALATLRARSAVLVATPDAFPFTRLAQIASVSGRMRGACATGILTARSGEALSRRIARIAWSAPGPARRNVHAKTLVHGAPMDARAHFEGPIETLVAVTHGSSIDMDLRLGVLCGRSTSAGAAEGYPCVMEKGCKRSPKGDRLLIPIQQLDARVVFAESCNGIALTGGLYADEASLALSAMDGTLMAYIATFKLVRSSQGLLACLGSALLEAGHDFGTVTSIVNRAQQAFIKDVPSFILLGDPCERLSRPQGAARLRAEGQGTGLPLSLDIDCGGFHGRALEIVLPLSREQVSRLDSTTFRVELTPMPRQDEAGFAVLLPSGDDAASLWLCVDEARRFDRVRVVCTAALPPESARLAVTTAWSAIDTLSALSAGVAAAASQLPGAEGCVRDLSAIVKQARELTTFAEQDLQSSHPHVTSFSKLELPLETLLGAYSALSARLVSRFPDWKLSAHLAWAYNHQISTSGDERPCGPCTVCGTPGYEITYSSPRSEHLRRTLIHCSRCGILSDRPSSERAMELRAPTVITAGETAHFEWRLRNDRPFPVEVSAVALFPHAPAQLGCRFSPETCTVTVPQGGEVIVPGVIEAANNALPGHYSLMVLGSGLMALNIAARPLRVEPRPPPALP
ncbi:hypothetical protein [Corallococcus carmarthensis]|uniref:Uncharacterized protein n=2 Tax=Corallococcus carmarthensis TaxID=2316728 RepID=A0A3A8JUD5_9BACT|nr:hypothetical protein [Corallococcus carmarthensis]RKG99472.1 hypothetical protein D7X32_26465 [Corallococcus carmarthensis]